MTCYYDFIPWVVVITVMLSNQTIIIIENNDMRYIYLFTCIKLIKPRLRIIKLLYDRREELVKMSCETIVNIYKDVVLLFMLKKKKI